MTGTEFATRRVAIDLHQAELAALLEVSERTVQRWEAAAKVPTIAECAIEHLTTLAQEIQPAD
jgi:DNA-binding transcriptional regulator YiaG